MHLVGFTLNGRTREKKNCHKEGFHVIITKSVYIAVNQPIHFNLHTHIHTQILGKERQFNITSYKYAMQFLNGDYITLHDICKRVCMCFKAPLHMREKITAATDCLCIAVVS